MDWPWILIVAGGSAAVAAACAWYARGAGLAPDAGAVPRRTAMLTTDAEQQEMFRLLQDALPELIVLTQVSMDALLVTDRAARTPPWSGERADFVVCSQAFEVLSVIGFSGNTAPRPQSDGWLQRAGYPVMRYTRLPTPQQLKHDVAPQYARTEIVGRPAARRPLE